MSPVAALVPVVTESPPPMADECPEEDDEYTKAERRHISVWAGIMDQGDATRCPRIE